MTDRIDLHTHTTASDGSFTPSALVDRAIQLGFGTIAVTDHDTVDGVGEALARARDTRLTVIPGVEMGAQHGGEMHILGLGVDIEDRKFLGVLAALRDGRQERNREMVRKLNALGLPVSWDDICAGREESVIGRAHIAHALMQKGVVEDMYQAFERYIGEGKPAYVERFRLSPTGTLEAIGRAGGLSVLAHPVQLGLELPMLYSVCRSLRERGLWGIEVYHPLHSAHAVREFLKLARLLGLQVTGGSDFHGLNKPDVELGDSVEQSAELRESCRILKERAFRGQIEQTIPKGEIK